MQHLKGLWHQIPNNNIIIRGWVMILLFVFGVFKGSQRFLGSPKEAITNNNIIIKGVDDDITICF